MNEADIYSHGAGVAAQVTGFANTYGQGINSFFVGFVEDLNSPNFETINPDYYMVRYGNIRAKQYPVMVMWPPADTGSMTFGRTAKEEYDLTVLMLTPRGWQKDYVTNTQVADTRGQEDLWKDMKRITRDWLMLFFTDFAFVMTKPPRFTRIAGFGDDDLYGVRCDFGCSVPADCPG